MSDAKLTWHFAAKSEITGVSLRTEIYAPVDTPIETILEELALVGYKDPVLTHKSWEKWAWPGGYPIYYVCKDGGILCSHCANENIKLTSDPEAASDWCIVATDINYEDPDLTCDHCSKHIESAYCASDDEGQEPSDADALASAGHGTDEDYGSAEDML